MAENLLRPNWASLDQHDLRLLLDARIGGPGQYDGRADNPNKFYLPRAREACKLILTYKGAEIISIEAGPAFDSAQWEHICGEIQSAILVGPQKVGREYSFSTHRVRGSWGGARSGVQILPPPQEAPTAPVEIAQHPFVLEFPIITAPDDLWSITNSRRIREHRQLTRVLNTLLTASITCEAPPTGSEFFWAHIPPESPVKSRQYPSHLKNIARRIFRLLGFGRQPQVLVNENGEFRWLQRFFFAPLGAAVSDIHSPPAAEEIEAIDPEIYYGSAGHDGRPLRVPVDLDDSLCRYRDLRKEDRAKFDRATFWMDIASRQWAISVSASFTSLVSAVESLTERGVKHTIYCEHCDKEQSHEFPGATERFRSFFETHAPGAALRERRSKMYALRSSIVHGGELLQIDQNRYFGWDPPGENQIDLHRELWSITQLAMRNWLKAQQSA